MRHSHLSFHTRLLILLLASTFARAASDQACYWPDGSLATQHFPCGDGSGHSACCGNNNDINTCLNGGLCLSTFGHVVRHACTDPTWADSACPRVCVDKSDPKTKGSYVNMVSCDSFQLWACYNESLPTHNQCAQGNFTLSIHPEITSYANVSVNVIKAMASASGSSIITVTTTATATASATPDNDNSKTVAVGAGVGAPLGIACLAALGMWLFERRQRKRLQNQLDAMVSTGGSPPMRYSPAGPGQQGYPYGSPQSSPWMQQKFGTQGGGVGELPGQIPPQELPGR